MRLVNTLANLVVVLATAAGVPPTFAFGLPGGACDLCSAEHAIDFETRGANRQPAEATASRDGARTSIATFSRAVPFQPGVLPNGIILHGLDRSGVLARQSDAFSSLVCFSSSLVRGPPLTD